jgi:hypothetical protein
MSQIPNIGQYKWTAINTTHGAYAEMWNGRQWISIITNSVDALTKELDVLLNGANAAEQASLSDIVSQVKLEKIRSKHHKELK